MQLIYYQNSLVSLVRYQALIPLLFSDETEQGYGPKYYTVFPCTHSDSSPYPVADPRGGPGGPGPPYLGDDFYTKKCREIFFLNSEI